MTLESEASTPDSSRRARLRQRMDLLSAVVMAAATVATAWSAYQSSLWNGEQVTHRALSSTAVIKVSKLSNLALQRTSVHVTLFVQWLSAYNKGDSKTADFLFARFPEPLRTAAVAWRATSPFERPEAPASPFDMPEYVLHERADADRWEQVAEKESAAAERAGQLGNRYLLFTIIYASVLFFGGISGKFGWQVLDAAVLVLGVLTLLVGVAVMLSSPRL